MLAERGLPAALTALALGAVVPVRTRIDAASTFEAPVESAVYFAAAEALTNISRHAVASGADLTMTHTDGQLHLIVTDDGQGGADPTCKPSSPRTRPCSATASPGYHRRAAQ